MCLCVFVHSHILCLLLSALSVRQYYSEYNTRLHTLDSSAVVRVCLSVYIISLTASVLVSLNRVLYVFLMADECVWLKTLYNYNITHKQFYSENVGFEPPHLNFQLDHINMNKSVFRRYVQISPTTLLYGSISRSHETEQHTSRLWRIDNVRFKCENHRLEITNTKPKVSHT